MALNPLCQSQQELFGDLLPLRMTRAWAMPSPETFDIAPINELLGRWLDDCAIVVDPFCGSSRIGTHRNDLRDGMDARVFCQTLRGSIVADAVLFDPPYSPRQIAEVYKGVGRLPSAGDTQNARLYETAKDALSVLLRVGGIAICCGWNSTGFGRRRGYQLLEILLVAHGGAHNDTIVTVERKAATHG